MSPEELVSEINACYKTFDRIIEKRGAEKIKTIGDAVNTASRMEKHSEVGKVNVSQATFELLKDDPQFAFESRGEMNVKGKDEMDMWFVKMKTERE